jgi:hypothetical protein
MFIFLTVFFIDIKFVHHKPHAILTTHTVSATLFVTLIFFLLLAEVFDSILTISSPWLAQKNNRPHAHPRLWCPRIHSPWTPFEAGSKILHHNALLCFRLHPDAVHGSDMHWDLIIHIRPAETTIASAITGTNTMPSKKKYINRVRLYSLVAHLEIKLGQSQLSLCMIPDLFQLCTTSDFG